MKQGYNYMHHSGAMSLACVMVMFLPAVATSPKRSNLRQKRIMLVPASGNRGHCSGDGMVEGGTIRDSESLCQGLLEY